MIHIEQMWRKDPSSSIDDDILFGKGIFPYSYLDDEAKLKETCLPPYRAFFDTLSNSLRITPTDYLKANIAFNQFQCKTFGDYMLRYLELDCRLLADIFEN